MKLVLEGQIESLKTRVDNSITVSFSTQEMDSTHAAQLFELRGKHCKALFSDTNVTQLEEELVDKTQIASTGKKNKTQSQRLRSAIYVFCEQQGIDFDENYNRIMNEFIETIKSKLE